MTQFSRKPLLAFQQALQQLLGTVSCELSVKGQPLETALGMVLAENIHSPIQIPAYTNAAMDGYAFRYADLENFEFLLVQGQSLAGHPYQGPLPPGCCIRIMTGAKLPAELDTVVMQEDVDLTPAGQLRILREVKSFDHVRMAGSEIAINNLVLTAGQRLGPLQIGLAATLGYASLPVYRRLKVGVISTGDELIKPGVPLANGQIYDSNRYILCAMLQRLDVELIDLGWVADDKDLLTKAFSQAALELDVLVTSGGVSVGDADYTRLVLEELGEVNFWQVAIKPGKPFAFGRLGQCWFFGLPGNPVSAVLTLDQLAQPALRKLAGEKWSGPMYMKAKATKAFRKKPGRLDFQRAVVRDVDGQLLVSPVGQDSSGMLSSLALANCLMVLEQPRGDVGPDETVQIQLLSSLFR